MSEKTDITPNDSIVPIFLIPPTPEEIIEQAQWEEERILVQEANQAKSEARLSALNKLAALGLTEEEIAAL